MSVAHRALAPTERFSATPNMCSVPLLITYPADQTRALSQQRLLAGPTLAVEGLWVARGLTVAGRPTVQKGARRVAANSAPTYGLSL